MALYTIGLDNEWRDSSRETSSSGGRLMYCWDTENQRNCHIFVSRIWTKPPIIMWFGALILLTIIKSSSFELERLNWSSFNASAFQRPFSALSASSSTAVDFPESAIVDCSRQSIFLSLCRLVLNLIGRYGVELTCHHFLECACTRKNNNEAIEGWLSLLDQSHYFLCLEKKYLAKNTWRWRGIACQVTWHWKG